MPANAVTVTLRPLDGGRQLFRLAPGHSKPELRQASVLQPEQLSKLDLVSSEPARDINLEPASHGAYIGRQGLGYLHRVRRTRALMDINDITPPAPASEALEAARRATSVTEQMQDQLRQVDTLTGAGGLKRMLDDAMPAARILADAQEYMRPNDALAEARRAQDMLPTTELAALSQRAKISLPTAVETATERLQAQIRAVEPPHMPRIEDLMSATTQLSEQIELITAQQRALTDALRPEVLDSIGQLQCAAEAAAPALTAADALRDVWPRWQATGLSLRVAELEDTFSRLSRHYNEVVNPLRTTELFGVSRALRDLAPFDTPLTDALRDRFGDWRGVTIPEPVLEQPKLRRDFYRDTGFDTDLTNFPEDTFTEGLAAVGLLPTARAPNTNRMAYDALYHVERTLRRFIAQRLRAAVGPAWQRQRIDGHVKAELKKRCQQAGGNGSDLLDYADLDHCRQIIMRRDNWDEIFGAWFHWPTFVDESIRRLQGPRNAVAHHRELDPEELMLLLAESRRLMRAMGVGL
jgi:hypothetical protein